VRAGRCPAKYRHQVRPAPTEFGGGGRGRVLRPSGDPLQTSAPPETPPAPLAAVGGVGGTWSAAGCVRVLTRRLLCGAGGAALGEEEGVRAPEQPLRVSAASGAWVLGCLLGPLPAALQGRAALQSQLPLPSAVGGGASEWAEPG
jgi:hypothetical protein